MQRNLHYLLLILFTFSITAFSQNAAGNVQVRLSLADGKTIYRMGEPIRLILTFTANGGEYNLLLSSEETASSPDEVFLSPSEGAFGWAAQYERGRYFMHDHFSYTKLAEKPINIDLPLNKFFRFEKPGKYSVYIKTKRVYLPQDKSPFDGKLIPLVSNTVEFEVKEMSVDEEREEIKRLGALLDSKKDWHEQARYAEDLSFLTGDDSTVEKVKRFLNPGDHRGNYQSHIRKGLLLAPNKSLAIKLLEGVLYDLTYEVNTALPYMLSELRLLQEDAASQPNSETDLKKFRERREMRRAEINRAYFDELVKTLPSRIGKSQLITAFTIFIQLPRDDVSSEAFNATKTILLEKFDELTPYGKEYLLGAGWEKIKTPALIASIEKVLANRGRFPHSHIRIPALRRLIEMDEKKARPVVISEILEPTSLASLEVLTMLKDPFLPETDIALLERIRVRSELNDNIYLPRSTALAARYATLKISDELMKIYKTHGSKWNLDARGALLAYFVRHNEKEALPIIEQELAGLSENQNSSFLASLTKAYYSEGINELLKKRLESDNPNVAGSVPWLMAKYGPASNEQVFRNRLARWRKEWSSRAAEIDAPGSDQKIKFQSRIEGEIILALIKATAWKLSETEIKQLKQSCVSQWCRQQFPAQRNVATQ